MAEVEPATSKLQAPSLTNSPYIVACYVANVTYI